MMDKNWHNRTLVALAVGWSLALPAQDWDEDLAGAYGNLQLVSIATGSAKPIDKAPAVASVITAQDIQAMGATRLSQVLESIPGLHTYPSSLNRMNQNFSIRGIHTGQNAQILMLVDGNPISYAWNGSRPDSFVMPLSAISRIEIVRGPGSALYGADAFAGVINIISKTADEVKQPTLGVGIGGWDRVQRYNSWYQQSGRQGELNWMFSAEWLKSSADPNRQVASDQQSLLDGVFGTRVSQAPTYIDDRQNILNAHLNLDYQNWKVRFWHWSNDEAGVGAGGAQALDHEGYNDVEQNQLSVEYQLPEWSERGTNRLKFNYMQIDTKTLFVLFPRGAVVTIGEDGNLFSTATAKPVLFPDGVIGAPSLQQKDYSLDWLSTYQLQPELLLKAGVGYRQIELDTAERKNFGPGVLDGSQPVVSGELTDVTGSANIFMEPHLRRNQFGLLQAEWHFMPDWELTLGARYDNYSDFGHTLNPRAALVWQTAQNLTTKLLYGSAFRAPSFDQLYAINNPVVLGNPDLKPETIDTYELAFDYRPRFDLNWLVNLYSYRAKDLIEFLPQGNGQNLAKNARDQQGYGLESEMVWQAAPAHQWHLNFAWQHSEDVATQRFIADAPRQHWYLGYRYQATERWLWSMQLNSIRDRERAAGDPRAPIEDFTTLDTSLQFKPTTDWRWQFTVSNLTDAVVTEPSQTSIPGDYPMSGRGFWLKTIVGF